MRRHLDDFAMHLLFQFLDGNTDAGCEEFAELARLVDGIIDRVLSRAVPEIAQAERMRAYVRLQMQISTWN
jgi:hypothetical protein